MTEPREPEFPDAGGRPVLPTPPDLPVAPAQPTGTEAPAWSFGAPTAPRPEPGVVPAPVAADQPTAEPEPVAVDQPTAEPEPVADQPKGAVLPEPPSVHSSEEDVPESVPAPAWTPAPESAVPVTQPEPEAPEPEPEAPAPEVAAAPEPAEPEVPAPAWSPAPQAPTAEPDVPAAEPEPPVAVPADPEPWQSSHAEPEPDQPWRPQAVPPQPVAEPVEPAPDAAPVADAATTPVTAQSPAEPQRVAETVSQAPVDESVAQPEPVASEWQPPAQPAEEPPSAAPADAVPEPEVEPTLVTPVAEPVPAPEAAAAAEPGVWTHTERPATDEPAASIWAPAPDTAPSPAEPAAVEEAANEPVVVPVLPPAPPPAPPLGAFVAPVQADAEATQTYPVTSARSPLAAPAGEPSDDDEIFRPSPGSLAGRLGSADQDEEERKLAAERNALREARAAALTTAGVPEQVDEAPATVVQQVVEVKRTTDGFWGSLGLFLLRLVLAGTFGVWGVQMLLDPAKTQSLFATTVLSYPILATIVPVASLLISVSMVIGLATRYAAFGAALISIGALVLVYWGSWSILVPNGFGFYGESELLIAAASLLIVFVGAGGWSLDGSLRRARAADKAARAS